MNDELLALADRIETVSAYSGRELRCLLYQTDRPESTANLDESVILIDARWRYILVAAVRAAAAPARPPYRAEPIND